MYLVGHLLEVTISFVNRVTFSCKFDLLYGFLGHIYAHHVASFYVLLFSFNTLSLLLTCNFS